jgi:transmembrane sensor
MISYRPRSYFYKHKIMIPELKKHVAFTYFSGDASPLQKQIIREWLKDTRNVETYFEWLEEFERMQIQFQPDTAAALQHMNERLLHDEEPARTPTIQPVRKTFGKWLQWAAASLLITGLTAYLSKDLILYRTYETAYGEVNSFSLDDSSSVVLNANSILKVPRWGFGRSTRNVYLEGEAEFSVRHTFDHQYFKVHTADKSLITVLGTEFVVYTRSRHTNVVLNTGKVALSSHAREKPFTMLPGDRATIESNGDIKIEKLTDTDIKLNPTWKEHRFVFDDTPLREVAEKIREVFGVVVAINNKELSIRTATGSFPAKNAEELLVSLSYMYNFEIIKTEKKIILIPNP